MKKIACVLVIFTLFLGLSVFAAQINSTSYKQNVIVSASGENISSSSYKMTIAMGVIAKIISSTSYINKLGFFNTWLIADGQPCSSASECEGGFCCSSLCSNSSCPSPSPSPGPSGGGGGGTSAGGGGGGYISNITKERNPKPSEEALNDFSISPDSIKEDLTLGAAKTKNIVIKNTGSTKLNFELSVLTVNNFVFLSENSFSLEPGQEKTLEVNMVGKKLGSYFGEIEAKANGVSKSISIVIDVESEQVLFDVKMDIPSEYKEIKAGDKLKAQITLLNVGPPKKVDVTTNYVIKNKRGSVIYEGSETFAVEKQTSFAKSFDIPSTAEAGDYLAVVEVLYKNSFAVSSELFKVVAKKYGISGALTSNKLLMFLFAVLIVLAVVLMVYLVPKINRFKRIRTKIRKRD